VGYLAAYTKINKFWFFKKRPYFKVS